MPKLPRHIQRQLDEQLARMEAASQLAKAAIDYASTLEKHANGSVDETVFNTAYAEFISGMRVPERKPRWRFPPIDWEQLIAALLPIIAVPIFILVCLLVMYGIITAIGGLQ